MNDQIKRLLRSWSPMAAVPWLLLALALIPYTHTISESLRDPGGAIHECYLDGCDACDNRFFCSPFEQLTIACWLGLLIAAFVIANRRHQQVAQGALFVLAGLMMFLGLLLAV